MTPQIHWSTMRIKVATREESGAVVAVNAHLFTDDRPFPYPEHDGNTVLDAAAFFVSLRMPGRVPLFTCICGDFGCGGCWTDVTHAPNAWVMRNCYDPTEDDPGKAELLDEWEVAVPWEQTWAAAETLNRTLNELRSRPHHERVYAGSRMRLDEVRLGPR